MLRRIDHASCRRPARNDHPLPLPFHAAHNTCMLGSLLAHKIGPCKRLLVRQGWVVRAQQGVACQHSKRRTGCLKGPPTDTCHSQTNYEDVKARKGDWRELFVSLGQNHAPDARLVEDFMD